jgi:hypothetical protein
MEDRPRTEGNAMAHRTLQVVSVETTISADTRIAAPVIHIHGFGPEHHGAIWGGPSEHHGLILAGELRSNVHHGQITKGED